MSRIHEALKRAEQERATGAVAEPVPLMGTELPMSRDGENGDGPAPLPVTQLPHAQLPVVPGGAPIAYETLLARCTPTAWNPDRKTMLFFGEDEQSRGTEEFRTLRSRLYQLRDRQPLKKVLVTSSLPKEGKTFVAANLAQVIVRQHGRRALLIDADLRGPRLHSALGTPSAPGLVEYLQGEADEISVLQRGPMENLFFIASGRSASSPAELVGNGRFRVLMARLEAAFDWIIVDSPPAVPVSDAALLANFCDGVLMVVRSDATPSDMARKARQEFRDQMLVGVVLNGIDAGAGYTQYYYGGYGRQNGKADSTR